MTPIQEFIKDTMQQQNISYAMLEKKSGVPKSAIQRYVAGNTQKIPLNRINSILKALGIGDSSISALLLLENSGNSVAGLSDMFKLTNVGIGAEAGNEDPETSLARQFAPAGLVIVSSKLNDDGNKVLTEYGNFLTGKAEYVLTEKERRFRLVQCPRNLSIQAQEPEPIMIRHYLTPAAAGYASPVDGEDYEDIPLPADAPTNADFCVDICGDSMEPYIKDGSTVYVERDAPLQELDVGVFFLDGDMFIKQFAPSYDGSVYLLSANPCRQDANKTISKNATSTLACYGKVILPHRLPMPTYD